MDKAVSAIKKCAKPSDDDVSTRFKRLKQKYGTIVCGVLDEAPTKKERARSLLRPPFQNISNVPVAVRKPVETRDIATQTLHGDNTTTKRRRVLPLLLSLALVATPLGVFARRRRIRQPPANFRETPHDVGPWALAPGECGVRADGVLRCAHHFHLSLDGRSFAAASQLVPYQGSDRKALQAVYRHPNFHHGNMNGEQGRHHHHHLAARAIRYLKSRGGEAWRGFWRGVLDGPSK